MAARIVIALVKIYGKDDHPGVHDSAELLQEYAPFCSSNSTQQVTNIYLGSTVRNIGQHADYWNTIQKYFPLSRFLSLSACQNVTEVVRRQFAELDVSFRMFLVRSIAFLMLAPPLILVL